MFKNAEQPSRITAPPDYEIGDLLHRHLAGAQEGAIVAGQVKVQADVIATALFIGDQFEGFPPGQLCATDRLSFAIALPG
ncbi:hypothetical protein [Ruegeria meonggei]|uniref:Uncharacterized protein n=1 Tax=Ruegeria meonggei TaxID=1446476 RepID=A0A1X6ZJP8_9RHOB|nr:hypothetical protein [Ruegeria meonggei]SLN51458.1 hypothetical protein RUM8411_02465 [Ruegeria meonggei]